MKRLLSIIHRPPQACHFRAGLIARDHAPILRQLGRVADQGEQILGSIKREGIELRDLGSARGEGGVSHTTPHRIHAFTGGQLAILA